MKTKINFLSSVKKLSATALLVLIASTTIWYADFATVKQKVQNMVAADSWDFWYILTEIFDLASGQIKDEFLEPTSPIWSVSSNDASYSVWNVGVGIANPSYGKLELYSDGATDGWDVSYLSLHRWGYTDWQLGMSNSDFVIAKGWGAARSTLWPDKYLTISATNGNVGMGNLKINNKVGTNEHTGITLGSSPDGGWTGSAELNFVGHGTSGDGSYIDYSVNNGRELKFRTIETDVNGNESGHATVMTLHDTGNVTIAGSLNVSCVWNCF